MGDFNVDLLASSGYNSSTEFYNNFSSYFFTPFVIQPTRLGSKKLIDNIFFNSLEYESVSGNLLYELSDHLIQFLILEGFFKERCLSNITSFYKRDFSNFNEREFEETVINSLDWDEICMLNFNDANLSFKSFFETINFYLDEMAPYKKVNQKQLRLMLKPWITKDILKKCSDRDYLLKSINVETDPIKVETLRNEYKVLRNEITKEKRFNKKAFFTSQFEQNKKKSSEIWKNIRTLVNIKPSKKANVKLINGNNFINDPKEIANIFNDHFSCLGSNVQDKIPFEHGDYNSYLSQRSKEGRLFINPNGCSFFLTPAIPEEIVEIIDALDSTKSTGPNSIPVFLLKTFKTFFSKWLSELINLSFTTAVFPDLLKIVKVTPIHKKGDKFDYQNYRPISLLSVYSKI